MNPYEILKQYGPGYGIPLLLFTSAVGAFVAGRPPIVPRVLAGIAVAWLLSYWVLSYFFLNPPDRPVKTGTGKLGFYVARVEEDPGNKRQKGLMQELPDGIAANPDLKKKDEGHDLCQTIPHGAPTEPSD